MGTYYIPRNLRGETRIFYIFTVKSLIATACGLLVGLPVTKKIGGEPVSEIIARWIKFNKNKKMYVYTKEEK